MRTKVFTVCAVAFSLVAWLGLVASASAYTPPVYVPPGNSVTDQYTEAYPWVGGDRTDRDAPRTPGERLGERNANELENAAGEDGEVIASVLASTGPPIDGVATGAQRGGYSGAAGNGGSGPGGTGEGAGAGGQAGGANAGDPLVGAATTLVADDGGSGISPVLWIVIATAVVALLGLAAGGWRAKASS